jgi:hypothetical protein
MLPCSFADRVEQLQALAAPLAGVPVADQILMYNGAKLDPLKQLSAYRLPVVGGSASLSYQVCTCQLHAAVAAGCHG